MASDNMSSKDTGSPFNLNFQSASTAASDAANSTNSKEVLGAQTKNSSVQKAPKSSKKRILKACDLCRKRKTKCFPSTTSIACSRCAFLGKICSFEREALAADQGGMVPIDMLLGWNENEEGDMSTKQMSQNRGLMDARLKMLQNDVAEILHFLKTNQSHDTKNDKKINRDGEVPQADVSANVIPINDVNTVKLLQYGSSVVDLNNLPSFGEQTTAFKTSALKMFTQLSMLYNIETPLSKLLHNSPEEPDQICDLITLGILNELECASLLQNFRDRYGRWVSFPEEIRSDDLLTHIRVRSPFLLTCCCLLALRYGEQSLKSRVYHDVLMRAKFELNENLAKTPQTLEFLQSLTILSLYGICLSTDDFKIDSWYLSGIALQHYISKDTTGQLFEPDSVPAYYTDEFHKLTCYRMWNNLSLCHLVYCISTGRMCVVDELRLALSRKILELSNSTNFDGRIVAEISCQLLVYNFVQFSNTSHALSVVKDELANWYDQWSYLFEQPANQFVGLGYHYGFLMILYNWSFKRLQLEQKSLENDRRGIENDLSMTEVLLNADSISIRNMIFHSKKMVDTMLDTHNDSYFAFLSDQIHFSCNTGITLLLNILHVLTTQNYGSLEDDLNKVQISKNELNKNLANCLMLSKRYKKISAAEDDIFMKYHETISATLSHLFPDFKQI